MCLLSLAVIKVAAVALMKSANSNHNSIFFKTHIQRWRFEAEVAEGIPQGLLGDCELSQLIGQGLSKPGAVFVALAVVSEQLEARLQVQIHRTRSSTQLLLQSLPGALQGRECRCSSDRCVLIRFFFFFFKSMKDNKKHLVGGDAPPADSLQLPTGRVLVVALNNHWSQFLWSHWNVGSWVQRLAVSRHGDTKKNPSLLCKYTYYNMC